MIHAQLILADSIETAPLPESFQASNADVQHIETSTFGIDQARTLITRAGQRPFQKDHHVFVVCTQSLTQEAQNALLKLFEEPPEYSILYLIVPHEQCVIPTLRSRFVQIISRNTEIDTEKAQSFLACSYAERLSYIAELHTAHDTATMTSLVTELGVYIAKYPEVYSAHHLRETLFVDSQIRSSGASKKMLLEHIALILPVK